MQFRVIGSKYSEHTKFRRWLLEKIENKKGGESYDQEIDKRFGEVHCYSTFEETGKGVVPEAAVEKITKGMYEEKVGKKKHEESIEKLFQLPRKLGEEFRVKEEMTVFAQGGQGQGGGGAEENCGTAEGECQMIMIVIGMAHSS